MLGQHELVPGESTTLVIIYDTYKFPGKFEKYVTVFTGPDGTKEHTITLTGMVDPIPMGVITVEPRRVEAGELALGRTRVVPMVIKNTGDAASVITRIYSRKYKTVYFQAANHDAILLNPGEDISICLVLTPHEVGQYLDYVMIDADARNVTEKGYRVVVLGEVQ